MIKTYLQKGKKYYEVYVAERDVNRKLIAKRKRGITSEREAKEVEFQFKSQLREMASGETKWTWEKWREEIFKRVGRNFKAKTLANYRAYLTNWVPATWSERSLNSVTTDDIYGLVEASGVRLSPTSKRTFLKILKRTFQEACDEGIISVNPARGFTVKTPESVKKVLTTSEVDRLLACARQVRHRFFPVWAFAVHTGMRSGEMYALLWSDIDFERNLISVNKQWTKADGVTPTKSRENRIVPMSTLLKEFLLGLHLKQEHGDYVLPRLTEWSHGDQAKVIKEFCKSIGMTDIKFHDLRATFITNLLSQGVPLVKVMAIVGHKRMDTTDVYLRLAGVDVQGATEALSYRVPTESEFSNVVTANFGLKK